MIVQNPLRRCAALGAAALLALAGCQGGGGGEEASSEDQVALTELSNRLVEGEDRAYTAEYLVEGTDEAVLVAVDPEAETAAVVVGDRPELWTGGDETELAVWLGQQLGDVLPSDEDVASWLAATAADPSASTEFSDTTLAGELADCVDVQGAADSPVGSFEVCVTTGGVIASVTAKVDDTAYTVKLVNYHDGVDAAWLNEITGQATSRNQ
ncbi:hypothetical protein [Glycomyces harbinensis]|uniref:Lipoprotein n=1 Tax=Glycomyces harbinensis TaxID=58114 RepID=A0A1G7BNA3_9ACTN|nr:hypothetical protein [Glycomyces harbinensis]SDE27665.1 hypothetical protein SAMN05216270_11721 [Glycomyces harbinensis]